MNIVQASATSMTFSAPWTAFHADLFDAVAHFALFHTQTHVHIEKCKCTHALGVSEAFIDCGRTTKIRGIRFNFWLMKVNKITRSNL